MIASQIHPGLTYLQLSDCYDYSVEASSIPSIGDYTDHTGFQPVMVGVVV